MEIRDKIKLIADTYGYDAQSHQCIEEIVKFAERRKIELSVMWGACFFFSNEDTANLNILTCFMDKERRKRKCR